MTLLTRSFHTVQNEFSLKMDKLARRHPYLAFLAIFVGAPMAILFAVGIGTALIALPVSWLCGWL